MGGPGTTCPGRDQIERLVAGEDVPPDILDHVETCPRCATRFEEATSDAKFLGRVRSLVAADLGPAGAPRISGYRPLGIVSSGAQGIVYRAVQESTSRIVAIKTLESSGEVSARQRLRAEREAEILANLRHPHIVTVYESRALSDGSIAMVMEYIDGAPLDAWLPPGKTATERRRNLLSAFSSICSAVHHAHLNGVIHRDIKPDNVLVTIDGRPVVIDFGIAKAGGIRATQTGEFAGTPAYASPEQVAGKPELVNALTDVYSLGVLLYRLLCRALPYEVKGSIFDIANTIINVEPVPLRQRDPTIPHDLEAIVLRSIRKQRERRYQSAAGFARDIDRYLAGDPVDARSGSGWYLLRKAVSLNRRRLGLAGIACLILVGAGAAVGISVKRAADAARLAHERDERARSESVRARAVTELLREALPNTELGNYIGSGLSRLYFRLETGAFNDDPDVDQTLRRLWGQVYTGFGSSKASALIEYAEVALRNGLVRLRLQHGEVHPEIAATMHQLAGVILVRKRPVEAEPIARAAIAMRERLLGPDNLSVADSRDLLSRILLAQGRWSDADAAADQAMALLQAHAGSESDLLAASLNSVKARVHLELNDIPRSEACAEEAIRRRLRVLPPEDPELLASLAAAAEIATRHPEGSLARILERAWPSGLGTISERVARDLPLLAVADRASYIRKNRTGRTEALGRLLKLAEVLYGPDDTALVGVLSVQIRSAVSEHIAKERVDAALRAADILSKKFGPRDLSVLTFIDEAAMLLPFAGQPLRAADLARRSCDTWASVPPPARDQLLAANSRRFLAWCLAVGEKYPEALEEGRRAMDELRAAVGTQHHVYASTENTVAYAMAELGDAAQADEVSQRVFDLCARLPSTPEDQRAIIHFTRGHILLKLGRIEECRSLLTDCWDPVFRYAQKEFPWRRVLLQDLERACVAMGDTAAAAQWRALVDREEFEHGS